MVVFGEDLRHSLSSYFNAVNPIEQILQRKCTYKLNLKLFAVFVRLFAQYLIYIEPFQGLGFMV